MLSASRESAAIAVGSSLHTAHHGPSEESRAAAALGAAGSRRSRVSSAAAICNGTSTLDAVPCRYRLQATTAAAAAISCVCNAASGEAAQPRLTSADPTRACTARGVAAAGRGVQFCSHILCGHHDHVKVENGCAGARVLAGKCCRSVREFGVKGRQGRPDAARGLLLLQAAYVK